MAEAPIEAPKAPRFASIHTLLMRIESLGDLAGAGHFDLLAPWPADIAQRAISVDTGRRTGVGDASRPNASSSTRLQPISPSMAAVEPTDASAIAL